MNISLYLLLTLSLLFAGCAASQPTPTTSIPQQHFNQGVALYNEGNYHDAIASFQTALNSNPASTTYSAWLGAAYCRGDKPTQGITIFTKLIQTNPNDTTNFDWLAQCYNVSGHYDDALVASKRAIQLNPNYANAYYNMGVSYLKQHQSSQAIEMFKKTLSLNASHQKTHIELGNMYAYQGDTTQSIQFLERACMLNPNDQKSLETLASLYYGIEDYPKALETITKAINLHSLVGIGTKLRIDNGRTHIVGIEPNSPASKAGLVVNDIIIKVNQEEMSDKTLPYIISKIKGNAGSMVALEIERNEKTLDVKLVRESMINQKAASAIEWRSIIHLKLNQIEKAHEDAQLAQKLNPSVGKSALGALALYHHRYKDAILYFNTANDTTLNSVLRTISYIKNGAMSEAKLAYKALIDDAFKNNLFVKSDRQALMNALSPIILELDANANVAIKTKNYPLALSAYTEMYTFAANESEERQIRSKMLFIIQKMGKLPELSPEAHRHSIRAEMMVKEAKYMMAIDEFEKAISKAPYAASLYFNTALVQAEVSHYQEAIANMKIYMQMAPEAPNIRQVQDEIIRWELLLENATTQQKIEMKPADEIKSSAPSQGTINQRRTLLRGNPLQQ